MPVPPGPWGLVLMADHGNNGKAMAFSINLLLHGAEALKNIIR